MRPSTPLARPSRSHSHSRTSIQFAPSTKPTGKSVRQEPDLSNDVSHRRVFDSRGLLRWLTIGVLAILVGCYIYPILMFGIDDHLRNRELARLRLNMPEKLAEFRSDPYAGMIDVSKVSTRSAACRQQHRLPDTQSVYEWDQVGTTINCARHILNKLSIDAQQLSKTSPSSVWMDVGNTSRITLHLTWPEVRSRFSKLLYSHEASMLSMNDSLTLFAQDFDARYKDIRDCGSVHCIKHGRFIAWVPGVPNLAYRMWEVTETFASKKLEAEAKSLARQTSEFEEAIRRLTESSRQFQSGLKSWAKLCTSQEIRGIWPMQRKIVTKRQDATDPVCKVDLDGLQYAVRQDIPWAIGVLRSVKWAPRGSYRELEFQYHRLVRGAKHTRQMVERRNFFDFEGYMWLFRQDQEKIEATRRQLASAMNAVKAGEESAWSG